MDQQAPSKVIQELSKRKHMKLNEQEDNNELVVLNPNEIALVVDSPEAKAQYNEVIRSLKAAQIPYQLEAILKTKERIIKVNEDSLHDLEQILLGLGVHITDDDISVSEESTYEDINSDTYEDEFIIEGSSIHLINQVMNGQDPIEVVRECCKRYTVAEREQD